MLMEILKRVRQNSEEELICHPLGTICFIVDSLNNGLTITCAIEILKDSKLSEESRKLIKNEQLMKILERQYSQIKDMKTVTTILCALIFHRVPRDIVQEIQKQECA